IRDLYSPAMIIFRIARDQTRGDSLHLGLRRFNSLSLPDPPDGLTIAAGAGLHLAGVARERRPDLGITRKFEIRRHYANDRNLAVVGLERSAHNLRIAAVASLPAAVPSGDRPRRT